MPRSGAKASTIALGASEAQAVELDRKLACVAEPAMRRQLVREALFSSEPEQAYALLTAVLNRSPQGGSPSSSACDLLRDAFCDVLLERGPERALPYRLRSGIYQCAIRSDDEVVMRMLRSVPAIETLERPELRLPRELVDIPLGRRRSLARGEDPYLLEKLALDPDPIVVEHLLRNPRITEVDIVRIAAMRPVAASTLTAVYRSPRWSPRGRVRTALARNPYCPVDIAIMLVGSLALPDLREMRTDSSLHPETRRQVECEIERRQSLS